MCRSVERRGGRGRAESGRVEGGFGGLSTLRGTPTALKEGCVWPRKARSGLRLQFARAVFPVQPHSPPCLFFEQESASVSPSHSVGMSRPRVGFDSTRVTSHPGAVTRRVATHEPKPSHLARPCIHPLSSSRARGRVFFRPRHSAKQMKASRRAICVTPLSRSLVRAV